MIFTVWTGKYVYLMEGEFEPWVSHEFDDSVLIMIHRIEAESEEDAKRKCHELMGWEPYVSMADALKRHSAGAIH